MSRRAGCRRADHPNIGRRELLQVGGVGLLGLGLSDLASLRAAPTKRHAKSVIFIFQSGGPSQHETWDPKPDAPIEIRGAYGTTATRLPGVRFCEYLPKLAARADKFSIVRTMHHTASRDFRNEHFGATYMVQTGRDDLPPGETNQTIVREKPGRFEWPSIKSLVGYAAPPDPGVPWPAVVEVSRTRLLHYPGNGPGVLGPRYGSWGLDLAPQCRAPDAAGSCPNCFSHDDPNDPARAPGKGPKAWWDNSSCRDATFRLPDLGNSVKLSADQLQNRDALLGQLDELHRRLDSPRLSVHEVHRRRAFDLISGLRPGRANPFDLTQESPKTRDQYGREEWGQAFLVARRLVEAGVRMVQLNLRGWDTHQNAFRDLKGKLLPSIDHCLSGLLDDLEQRGLRDDVLIVMCGEMGRTPKVSPITVGGKNASGEVFTPGRHHWGDVFPCFFSGGGTRHGQIIGQTDKHGGQPASEAYTPSDLAATILRQLGVSPEAEFHDAEGRPYKMTLGTPIPGLV